VIVAGGGGGSYASDTSGYLWKGGHGGGSSGGTGAYLSGQPTLPGQGGTHLAGGGKCTYTSSCQSGSFGYEGNGSNTDGINGGGSGFYGGGSGYNAGGGCGGSGFVFTESHPDISLNSIYYLTEATSCSGIWRGNGTATITPCIETCPDSTICPNPTPLPFPSHTPKLTPFACPEELNYQITEGITEIKSYEFFNCINLKNIIIPNSLLSIGFMSFAYCSGLINITIPEKVTQIYQHTFSYCSNLSSIIFLGDIKIGPQSFFSCTSLNNITIFGNLTFFSSNIFNNLNKNITINYYGSKYVDEYIDFLNIDNITIYVCSNYLFHSNTFGGHNVLLSPECFEYECIFSHKIIKYCIEFPLIPKILRIFQLNLLFNDFSI
jgi:hypothetical protein